MTTILILIIVVILIISILWYNLTTLNLVTGKCDFIDYNSATTISNEYFLNIVAGTYNQFCGHQPFLPELVKYNLVSTISVFGMFSTKNLSGLVYLINGNLIISFRGTHTKAEELIDSEIELYKYSDGTSIHKGFRNYFLSMSDQINSILLAEKGNFNSIYITGHSLGASTALVCAWNLLLDKVSEPINVITFACPKTGNKQFVEYLQSNLKSVTNIVNYFDIVPESPETFGKLYSIKPIYIFGIETDSDIVNHSLPIYNQGLEIMTLLNEST